MSVAGLILSGCVFLISARIVVDPNGKWGEQAWQRLFPDTPLGRAYHRFMGFATVAICLGALFMFTRSLNARASKGILYDASSVLAVLAAAAMCVAIVAALFNWPAFASTSMHRGEPGYIVDAHRERHHRRSAPKRTEIWDKPSETQLKRPMSTRTDGQGKIVFYRTRAGGDNRRRYKLEVDGQRVGMLSAASTLEITVPAGIRVCQARIDWTGSEETEVPVTANGTTRVLVAGRADRMPLESARWLELTVDQPD